MESNSEMTFEDIALNIKQGAVDAFIEYKNSSNLAFKPEFVVNNHEQGQKVLSVIDRELADCEEFAISVAFITESGIVPLLQTLKDLERKGIKGRILTTDYLCFSEPKALDKLASLSNVTLKMYDSRQGMGFHTKGYIFERDGVYRILIGSSNMTQSALTVNQEWNAKIVSTGQGEFAQRICDEFDSLWNSVCSVDYDLFITEYRQKYEMVQRQRRIAAEQEPMSFETARLEPNSMQVAFTNNLKKTIERGNDRALLISATGTGKTYASAFGVRDALPTEGKVLFIVHRKQILRQALTSYKRVFGINRSMALLTGDDQDYDSILNADFVFAMITMVSKDEVLEKFDKKAFKTIVVDEVHHASANSYQKVMHYFEPDFWLGMTATPDRTDGGNIYELFNHNIVYEIRLQQALENDLLCPFHYFGIKDIAFDENANADELIKKIEKGDLTVFNQLTRDERVNYVVDQATYYGFCGERVKGLIFCSSVREAKALSEKFNEKGWKTLALSGDDSDDERREAIERLVSDSQEDYLDYILTVNIFNEGVDLPEINQVIMLRPTQSAIVFIQQLGRGLRKRTGKDYVVILDFIGNYSNNFLIPIALSGDRTYNKDNMRKYLMEGSSIIPGCSTVHFDEISKQSIFSAIDKATTPLSFLKEKYFILKDRLGRMPTVQEFYKYGEVDPLLFTEYKSSKKTSYYEVVSRIDKDSGLAEFTELQSKTLDFISTQIINGKRPHELIVVDELLKNGAVNPSKMMERLGEYNIIYRQQDYDSAIRVLDKTFLNTQSDKAKFEDVKLFDDEQFGNNQQLLRCAYYLRAFTGMSERDKAFRKAMEDLIGYGLQRNKDWFSKVDEDGLVLYQKYSRRDVCRILDWERDDSSTVYGYRIKHGTCPIFVTYEKKEDISETTKYEDQFIDPQLFSWMTRSRVSENSPESREIINYKENGLKLYLFVKKSDGEGTDFYYMGRVNPVGHMETTIKDKNGKEFPIMNFKLKLDHAVRSDIFDYLTN